MQEAIKNEINLIPNEDISIAEINVSDIHLTFNPISTIFENSQILRKGVAITYGSPLKFKKKFVKNNIKFNINSKPKYVFISTTVLRGNINGFRNSLNDYDNLELEIDIIRNVLGKSKNKFTYKPYGLVLEEKLT